MTPILLTLIALAAPGTCQVRMLDSLNQTDNLLSAHSTALRGPETSAYEVTDKIGTPKQTAVRASFASGGPLLSDVGVPHPTEAEMLAKYAPLTQALLKQDGPVDQDGQLTWEIVPGASCSATDLTLIQFFVMEWFYFG